MLPECKKNRLENSLGLWLSESHGQGYGVSGNVKILAVSPTEKSLDAIRMLLERDGAEISLASSASSARRRILDEEWDTVVINFPLQDESGMELASMAAAETNAAVIMLMRRETAEEFSHTLLSQGILIVEKPIVRQILQSTLSLSSYIKMMREENNRKIENLERRLDEMKIVSKAKCAIVRKKDIEEEEAHKLIERTAMNRRISLKDAALYILRTMIE